MDMAIKWKKAEKKCVNVHIHFLLLRLWQYCCQCPMDIVHAFQDGSWWCWWLFLDMRTKWKKAEKITMLKCTSLSPISRLYQYSCQCPCFPGWSMSMIPGGAGGCSWTCAQSGRKPRRGLGSAATGHCGNDQPIVCCRLPNRVALFSF